MARRVKPMTPRTVRCDDDLWKAANQASDFYNENISEVFRRALAAYVARYERDLAKKQGE